jgi:transcriptional regulator with XRE-family HTH domain
MNTERPETLQELQDIIGNAIKRKRLQLRLSQMALAEQSELDLSYVGRIERGEVNPSIEKLLKIAQVLGCPVRDLLLEE